MDPKTHELLLKTRKGSTAQFGVKEWGTVLPELGFTFQTAKTGRTVTEVKVISPLGAMLTITKEPHYKRITFYKLSGWLKEHGFDLVESSSARLGMDTPEVERKLKDLYVRDLTNTGTCPVCEGNFKRNSAEHYDPEGLVHHGFQRPGDGAIHGDCFAVGYQPWELSPKGAVDYLAKALVPHLEGLQMYLTQLKNGEIKKFFKQVSNGYGKPKTTVEVTMETDSMEFQYMTQNAISKTEREIQWANREIKRFENKIANWKLDVLPEVKYAGKFNKV